MENLIFHFLQMFTMLRLFILGDQILRISFFSKIRTNTSNKFIPDLFKIHENSYELTPDISVMIKRNLLHKVI